MPDLVVTVPKTFRYAGRTGLAAWVAEGCLPGQDPDDLYVFSTYGPKPNIVPGERVYVVCEGRLRGYAPLVELRFEGGDSICRTGRVLLIRGGGAVACTLSGPVQGFQGWRYRWWERAAEQPFPDWAVGAWDAKHAPRKRPASVAAGQKTLIGGDE